jgi:aspartate/methionine/tyrosine aminotransferase
MNIEDAELELRTKVAHYYNTLYKSTRTSKYTADNICIVRDDRAGITRIMAVLGNIQIGYFTPDYIAYEQVLGLFIRVSPSPMLHRNINEAYIEPSEFEFQVSGHGAGAVLMSNPTNPTGQSLEGEDLKRYVEIAREYETVIIMDEFYS